MTNDEIPMTKREHGDDAARFVIRHSSFVIDSSFEFRHSDLTQHRQEALG